MPVRPQSTVVTVPASGEQAFGVSSGELGGRWGRAALGTLGGAAFGFGLVVLLRAISGLPVWQTEQTGYPHVVVPVITGALGFLLGFGAL
ncbi:MAG TPA: hypothetical protein VEB65_10050, partial [Solirubrobacterales bacterium]|nr:hypothetical protein [Solirubrobacterales bacterium]